jgi:D-alanine--poly(phosphoribitol) ligase subunit 2
MPTREQIEALVLQAIEITRQQLPPEPQFPATAETVLFGQNGIFDSLGLVNLILEIETCLTDEFDITLVLADEKAMSQKRSPFRTAQALTDYIVSLLEPEPNV